MLLNVVHRSDSFYRKKRFTECNNRRPYCMCVDEIGIRRAIALTILNRFPGCNRGFDKLTPMYLTLFERGCVLRVSNGRHVTAFANALLMSTK
ncbi:MAG: hypothetical protein Ct9H300mP8_09650 [Gammaproteobacteria bacterium]|nr:MAG: hypothetical protein Ct9H300mP8_09650 [Gammaproteobacteria bacterium]